MPRFLTKKVKKFGLDVSICLVVLRGSSRFLFEPSLPLLIYSRLLLPACLGAIKPNQILPSVLFSYTHLPVSDIVLALTSPPKVLSLQDPTASFFAN